MTSLQPGLDPAVEAIVLKALTKQPGQRYQTCAELAAAVDCYVPRGVAEILDGAGPRGSPGVPSGAADAHPSGSNSLGVLLPGVAVAASLPAIGMPSQRRSKRVWLAGGMLATLLFLAGAWEIMQPRRPSSASHPLPESPPSSSERRVTAIVPGQSTIPTPVPQSKSEPSASRSGVSDATPHAPRSPSPLRKPIANTPTSVIGTLPASPGAKDIVPPRGPERTSAVPSRPPEVPRTEPTQPGTAQGYMLRGDLAFQQGQYGDALVAYSQAYQTDPNNREVRRKIAVVLTLLGRPEEAQRYK